MYRPVPSIGSKSCLWVVGWMYQVDVYLRVRRAVMVDGMSIWEVSRVFGLHRDTVRKILAYSVPPGYRRQTPPRRPNPSTSSGVPYSTRPSGSLCRATYSDHEGLDFHWNRHAAVHWNRPPNSVDLEQREGELGLGDDGGERLLHPHRLGCQGRREGVPLRCRRPAIMSG